MSDRDCTRCWCGARLGVITDHHDLDKRQVLTCADGHVHGAVVGYTPRTKANEADLRAILEEAIRYEAEAWNEDDEINGGDLVEWFGEWRVRAIRLLGGVA